MADWKSVKSISDKYGISVERVIAWVRESQITTSVVGSVVLIDDGSVCELVEKEKRLAHLKTNYEQLCAKFEQRIEAELRAFRFYPRASPIIEKKFVSLWACFTISAICLTAT